MDLTCRRERRVIGGEKRSRRAVLASSRLLRQGGSRTLGVFPAKRRPRGLPQCLLTGAAPAPERTRPRSAEEPQSPRPAGPAERIGMMDKDAWYTRVSSPGQATADAVSLDAQEAIARGISARDGAEVIEHYQDAGRSATQDSLDNRPAMRRLLAAAAAGKFTRLVVVAEDRLARNTEAAAAIASVLKLAGVKIVTPKGEIDFTDRRDKLLYYVNGYASEDEAAKIIERCNRGKLGYAERGDFPQWQEPFGYRWVEGDLRRGIPNRLETIPEQLATVRLAYGLADRGWTVRRITAELNRRHLHTRGGNLWYPGDVADMLKEPRYQGVWRVWKADGREYFAREELVPELAVTRKQWQRAQQAIAHHRRGTRRPMQHAFLLNGCLVCAECGSMMIGHQLVDPLVRRYYVCSKKKANVGKPCSARYVPAEPLEAEVLTLLEELAEHPDRARAYAEATRTRRLPGLQDEAGRIERALEGADQKLETLLRKLADEVITDEHFRAMNVKLEGDKAAWRERLAEIESQIADAEIVERAAEAVADRFTELERKLADLDLQERRWLLA